MPRSSLVLHVHGNSMNLAGIQDGDRVFVDLTATPTHGDIVAAEVGEEGNTVKRLSIVNGEAWLLPDSDDPQWPSRLVTDEVRVLGVAVGLIKDGTLTEFPRADWMDDPLVMRGSSLPVAMIPRATDDQWYARPVRIDNDIYERKFLAGLNPASILLNPSPPAPYIPYTKAKATPPRPAGRNIAPGAPPIPVLPEDYYFSHVGWPRHERRREAVANYPADSERLLTRYDEWVAEWGHLAGELPAPARYGIRPGCIAGQP